MNDIERLKQLRVASYTQCLPADLATWVIAFVEDAMPHVMRVRQRNDFLQQAANLLPPTFTKWAKAAAIAGGLRGIRQCGSSPSQFDEGSFEWLLASTLECDKRTPTSTRHILRLLEM